MLEDAIKAMRHEADASEAKLRAEHSSQLGEMRAEKQVRPVNSNA
jgi:hypothetical protein